MPPYKPAIERFKEKYIPEPMSGCWIWLAGINHDGYGIFSGKPYYSAHRFSYALKHGSIPKGKEIDHLCKNRACCNPDHLEAVTHEVNIKRGNYKSGNHRNARKTHCVRGHELTGDNLYMEESGDIKMRKCRFCRNMRQRVKWRKQRGLKLFPGGRRKKVMP